MNDEITVKLSHLEAEKVKACIMKTALEIEIDLIRRDEEDDMRLGNFYRELAKKFDGGEEK